LQKRFSQSCQGLIAAFLVHLAIEGYRAAGGIYNYDILNLTSVTVAYNTTTGNGTTTGFGGVVYNNGSANLSNTIVAKNTAAAAPDFYLAISSASSYNLIGDGSGMSGITAGTNGNQIGIDPKLDPALAYMAVQLRLTLCCLVRRRSIPATVPEQTSAD
jgi:hypothetical protein